jgi:serine protease Do
VGVISVAARKLPTGPSIFTPSPKSGYLGIALAPSESGATIAEVLKDTAAAKARLVDQGRSPSPNPDGRAGLKAKDTILAIGGKPMKNVDEVLVALSAFKPGDVIRVRIKRGDQELVLEAKLGQRPLSRLDVQEQLGGPLSKVRLGFPVILQHDTVLKPTDCGGPLVDLDGHVVGINIARAGRTETYALPTEVILPLLGDLRSGKLAPRQGKE